MFGKKSRFQLKTPAEFDAMRAAGLVVADTLQLLRESVRPGMTTADLDSIARESISGAGAEPSFLGYHGFPAVICVSVNEEIVHGIPGGRVINQGDVVSIDCGAIVDGWHGDAAFSMAVGDPAPEVHGSLRSLRPASGRVWPKCWLGTSSATLGTLLRRMFVPAEPWDR